MNEMNPYASPSAVDDEEDDFSRPLFFAGVKTKDDLLLSLMNAPPAEGIRKYVGQLTSVLVFGGMLLFIAAERATHGVFWLLLGASLLPIWMPIAIKWIPGYRKRREILEETAKSAVMNQGWLGGDLIVLNEGNQAYLRAPLESFAPVHFFPEHFFIATKLDTRRRFTIPCRFFYNAVDAIEAGKLLGQKIGVFPNTKLDEQAISQIEQFSQVSNSCEPFGTEWSIDDWPFQSNSENQHDAEINLVGHQKGILKWTFISCAYTCGFIGWALLPIWVVAVIWLVAALRLTGDLSMLATPNGLTLIVPVLGIWGMVFFAVASMARTMKKMARLSTTIRLRDTGFCIIRESSQSWLMWSAIDELVLDDKSFGWIDAETKEQFKLPKACFSDPAAFQDIKAAARRLCPSTE